ncbi:unnamed protein product, partial [Musa acuminata var. zebrina]
GSCRRAQGKGRKEDAVDAVPHTTTKGKWKRVRCLQPEERERERVI